MTDASLETRLRAAVRTIPDFPKPGIDFRDIAPILLQPDLFRDTLGALADWTAERGARKVVGVDARGFLFAGAVADRLGIGLIPVRKPGKLPFTTLRAEYDLEYGTNALEIHTDAVEPGEPVVVVDDLLATGGTVKAAASLVERLGGRIAGCAFVIELNIGGRAQLEGYECMSLVTFE